MTYKTLLITLVCAGLAAVALALLWRQAAPLESFRTGAEAEAEARDAGEPIPTEEAPATGAMPPTPPTPPTTEAERTRVVEARSDREPTIDETIRDLMEGPVYPEDYGGPRDERAAYLYKVFAASLLRMSDSMDSIDRESSFGRQLLRSHALTTARVEKLQRNDIFAMSVNGSPPLPTPPNDEYVLYDRLNMNGLDLIIKITRREYPDAFLESD